MVDKLLSARRLQPDPPPPLGGMIWAAAARRPGRPAAPDGLMDAAVWLIHLAPARPRACTMTDVANLLLACQEPAVKALVGRAGSKTLCNRLAWCRREVLSPEWWVLSSAMEWARDADLPAQFPEGAEEPPGVTIANASRLRPGARDALMLGRDALILARAVSDRVDVLPPEAQEALERLLQCQSWIERLEEREKTDTIYP
jgi:hypothetical protein